MMKKWTSLITLLGLFLGLTRTSKQPYRKSIIMATLGVRKLGLADEIIVTNQGLTLIESGKSEDALTQFAPLTDDEKRSLTCVLTLVLSGRFQVEKRYDQELTLSNQVNIHYIKTEA